MILSELSTFHSTVLFLHFQTCIVYIHVCSLLLLLCVSWHVYVSVKQQNSMKLLYSATSGQKLQRVPLIDQLFDRKLTGNNFDCLCLI